MTSIEVTIMDSESNSAMQVIPLQMADSSEFVLKQQSLLLDWDLHSNKPNVVDWNDQKAPAVNYQEYQKMIENL